MSDIPLDAIDDVVGVLTEQVEARFGMNMDQLKAAVAAAPTANADATGLVKWHGLLLESQAALERAEDALLASLDTQPSEVDDPTMALAHRVNAAVTARDGRAMVVRWLLDPNATGKQNLATERLARVRGRRGPAVPTSAPPRPASQPGRSLSR
ncbi:hypothetical protein [Streptomyces colonosanans]|uniref:Uncharacterized protein n=1 Tax=Streptomyces colonosanans TaxID=1428652 RepID=A0A1S2PDG4_9ACTN|nr:hypothetical protein [Streptomyces colonosanans]OIJ91647.1 hypothetical protein BIV24_15420 [Streptomyces colonosanans]